MTVAQLIKILEFYDRDMVVYVWAGLDNDVPSTAVQLEHRHNNAEPHGLYIS